MQDAFQKVSDQINAWRPGQACQLETLAQAGSNRQYFRINYPDQSYILTYNPLNIPENNAFIEFTKHFSGLALPVPNILLEGEAREFYVQ